MKRGAKVTRYRQRAKGVSRIVEAFIRSSPKGGARRRRHAPKQKAPPRRVELAKAHPLNGGYLERHALRARILNAPARIVTQFTPYIHPLQGWRSYLFFSVCFLSISSKSGGYMFKKLGTSRKTLNPLSFSPFFSRRRGVKPKGKANQGERGRKSMQARKRRRPNVLRNGANHLQRRGRFSGGAFFLFARVFCFSPCN